MRQPIRNISSGRQYPARLFDIVIDDDNPDRVYIEQKHKDRTERIPWEDVKYQVDSAIRRTKSATIQKLPPLAP